MQPAPQAGDSLARTVRRTITAVVFLTAGLSFAFGFGNGWVLGLKLGVPGWIAPLVAPAVDLSVVGLLAAMQFLRAHGIGGRLVGPRLLLAACGLITFALNTVRPLLAGQLGRACFDAVSPLLLVGWSEVGPRLLAVLYRTVPDRPRSQDDAPHTEDARHAIDLALLAKARQLDTTHQQATGKRLTRDALRAKLRVSNAVAGALLRELRPADSSKL